LHHYSAHHYRHLYQQDADARIVCPVPDIFDQGIHKINSSIYTTKAVVKIPQGETYLEIQHIVPQYLHSESVKFLLKLSTVLFIHTDSYIIIIIIITMA
jgi:hypothetical protein